MVRGLIYAIILGFFTALSPVLAASISYAPTAQILVVSEVAIGEEVTVKYSDLTELVTDISNDDTNIEGTIFIRVFLKKSDRNRIENIIKTSPTEAQSFAEPLAIFEKTPNAVATQTKVRFAQVSTDHPITDSLYYNEPNSVQKLSGIDRYTFSIRNFDSIEPKSMVVFQINIEDIWNYTGDLKFTIKLLNEPAGNAGTGSGSGGTDGSGGTGTGGGGGTDNGGTTTSVDANITSAIIAFSSRTTDTQNLLNKNYICEPTETNNTENICDAQDLETLSTNLSLRIADIKTNRNFLESLSSFLKQKRASKAITKLQNRALQVQIKKALTVNLQAVKNLKLFKAAIDKYRIKPNTFQSAKKQALLQKLKANAQTKVNRVDALVNVQIASDLLGLGLIDQATFSGL